MKKMGVFLLALLATFPFCISSVDFVTSAAAQGAPQSLSHRNRKALRYHQSELLVKLRPGSPQRALELQLGKSGLRLGRPLGNPAKDSSLRRPNWRIVKVAPGVNPKDALEKIAAIEGVADVSLNYELIGDAIPDDPSFHTQWSLRNTGVGGGIPDADVDADEAWDTQTGSSSVVVAIIDSGAELAHPDIAANFWTNATEIADNGIDDDGNGYVDDVNGYDFFNVDPIPDDQAGHGTEVAGVIGAAGNNGTGIAGVAWNVRLMPLRFMDDNAVGYVDGAVEAIYYAIDNGARIINASFGNNTFSQPILDAISAANDAGILFVASAGNDGSDNDVFPHYPSSYDLANIIAVASTDNFDTFFGGSGGSNFGAISVDVGAPGVLVPTTTLGGGYISQIGTSIAAPHVSGAAALLLSQDPSLTAAGLKALLLNYGDPNPTLAGRVASGRRLNIKGLPGFVWK